MEFLKKYILSPQQRKIVEGIRRKNRQKTVKSDFFGNLRVDLNAVALTQDLERVINRAREINDKS